MRTTSLLLAALLCGNAGLAWAGTNLKAPDKPLPQMSCEAPCRYKFDKCKKKVLGTEKVCCSEADKVELTKCTSALYQCLKPCPVGNPDYKGKPPPSQTQ